MSAVGDGGASAGLGARTAYERDRCVSTALCQRTGEPLWQCGPSRIATPHSLLSQSHCRHVMPACCRRHPTAPAVRRRLHATVQFPRSRYLRRQSPPAPQGLYTCPPHSHLVLPHPLFSAAVLAPPSTVLQRAASLAGSPRSLSLTALCLASVSPVPAASLTDASWTPAPINPASVCCDRSRTAQARPAARR